MDPYDLAFVACIHATIDSMKASNANDISFEMACNSTISATPAQLC
jgi:hypothetical protein